MTQSLSYPLVSIVIPVYNGTDFLRQAIDSALAQTWPNCEVIVVNDGSDDNGGTAAVAASYGDRIRYEYKTNGGVATAINRGVSLMRGGYMSWLSHDDVYAPDKIARMMKAVLDFGEPVVAFGDFALMDESGGSVREVCWTDTFDIRQPVWTILEGRINGCAMIVPKVCFDTCGYLRPDLPGTQDYDLWFRMALRFPFLHVPGVMVYHRQHKNQGSRSPRFASEVDLLFLSMFDRITDEIVASHARSAVSFYSRARATLTNPGAAAALDRIIRRHTRHKPVSAVLWDGAKALETAACIHALRTADINLVSVALPRPADEDCSCLTLSRDDGSSFSVTLIPAASSDVKERLGALVDAAQGEFVWMNSSVKTMETNDGAGTLSQLMAGPAETVACLPAYPDGRLFPAPLRVLEGAVIRTQPLRAALAQSTGSLTSVVHALSRLGSITVSVIADAHPATARVISSLPGAGDSETQRLDDPNLPPPVKRARMVRLFAWLNKSAFRSRVLTGILWKLFGSGDRACGRLLRWSGLEGWLDADWYRERYRDVAAAGVDPGYHYLMFGLQEGRDPSPLFSSAHYLCDYPDVAAAGVPPLQHYVLWGRHEGRRLRPVPTVKWRRALPDAVTDGRPCVFIVAMGSPAAEIARFAGDLAEQVAPRLRVLYLCGPGDGTAVIRTDPTGENSSVFELPATIPALVEQVERLDIRRALVFQHHGFSGCLPALLEALAVPFDVIHLNYEMVADRAYLPGPSSLGEAPEEIPESWRTDPERKWLVEHADRHFAPSEDCAARLRGLGLDGAITVAPPPDSYRLRGFRVWGRPVVDSEPLRLALFGPLTAESGTETVRQVLTEVRKRRLPLRFLHFTQTRTRTALHEEFADMLTPVTAMSGPALTVEICRWHPHVAWFPYGVAVPHGYAMIDAQASGLPIVASAVGAFPELLKNRPLSWLLPEDSAADGWIECFLRLRDEGMITEWSVPHDAPGLPDDHRLYQRHLYTVVFGSELSKRAASNS